MPQTSCSCGYFEEIAHGTRWSVGASLVMPEPIPRLAEWLFFAPMLWAAARDLAGFKKAMWR